MGSPMTKLQLRYPTRASQVDQPSTLRRHAILSKTDPQGPNTNDLNTQSRDKKRIWALDRSSHIRVGQARLCERRPTILRVVGKETFSGGPAFARGVGLAHVG